MMQGWDDRGHRGRVSRYAWKTGVSLCRFFVIVNLVRSEISQEIEAHPEHVCEGVSRELVKARVLIGVEWRSFINTGSTILWDAGLDALKWKKGESQSNSPIPLTLFFGPL